MQPGAYLLELSLDWIVVRASENVHRLLGHSHVIVVDEPLGKFVHSEALHDLRNLFSRLSGTTGIARAYRIRLTDDPDLFDIAFQLSAGRVLLEAVPSPGDGLGQAFGSVGGLVAGLAHSSGQALLDAAARRMRALTGYDRVTLDCGDRHAESRRGALQTTLPADCPVPNIVADSGQQAVPVFPREADDSALDSALLRAPPAQVLEKLRAANIGSVLCIPFALEDGSGAEFRCESRLPRQPGFELHAAAELFAQLFAQRLEIDRLKDG